MPSGGSENERSGERTGDIEKERDRAEERARKSGIERVRKHAVFMGSLFSFSTPVHPK